MYAVFLDVVHLIDYSVVETLTFIGMKKPKNSFDSLGCGICLIAVVGN